MRREGLYSSALTDWRGQRDALWLPSKVGGVHLREISFLENGPVEKFPEFPELPSASALAAAVQTCAPERHHPIWAYREQRLGFAMGNLGNSGNF